jgi:hypothetical protein
MLSAALLACAPAMNNGTDGGASTPDAAVCTYSEGPFGFTVGETIRNFELARCSGEGYAFGGPDHCQYRATLVILAAGW